MTAIKSWYTIWEFRGVSIPQKVVVAKPTEPNEIEHEYQRILGRFEAFTPVQALRKFKLGEGK